MKASLRDQLAAFAGMLQSAELVRQIATGGQFGQAAARASLESVFQTRPESVESVYGGLAGIRLGLGIARDIGENRCTDARSILHHTGALIRLSTLLRRDRPRQQRLARGLELIDQTRADAGDVLDPSVIAQLADLYRREISTLSQRIQISGRPEYLRREHNVHLIRALLLAGIRSGVLWLQLGGRPWRLLFQRNRLFRLAAELAP